MSNNKSVIKKLRLRLLAEIDTKNLWQYEELRRLIDEVFLEVLIEVLDGNPPSAS